MKNLFLSLVILIFSTGYVFSQYSSGNALYFDGEDDYVRISDNDNLDIVGNLTISAWVYGNNYEEEDLFVHKINAYGISIRSGGKFALLLSHNPSGTMWEEFTSDFVPSQQTWYHFAATYDSSAQEVKLYVNGELQNTLSYSNPIAVSTGALQIGGHAGGQHHFGKIDEVRIWNVTRSREQILSTFSDTLGSFYYFTSDSGLVGYWRFDEGTPGGDNSGITTLPDLTYNGLDGTLYNFALTGGTSNWVDSGAPISDIHNVQLHNPTTCQLTQNYPNPFNPKTVISWQLPVSNRVDLSVYNIRGQKVATILSEKQNSGNHSIEWDASAFSSGIYFYCMKAGDFVQTKRMLLIK